MPEIVRYTLASVPAQLRAARVTEIATPKAEVDRREKEWRKKRGKTKKATR